MPPTRERSAKLSTVTIETEEQILEKAVTSYYMGKLDAPFHYVARWMALRGTPFSDEKLVLRQYRAMVRRKDPETVRRWLKFFIARHSP